MDDSLKKQLSKDETGLATYEYIANNIESIDADLPELVANIINVDLNGQFVVSTARYLCAIDSERYADSIDVLVKAAIEKDREHKRLDCRHLRRRLQGACCRIKRHRRQFPPHVQAPVSCKRTVKQIVQKKNSET